MLRDVCLVMSVMLASAGCTTGSVYGDPRSLFDAGTTDVAPLDVPRIDPSEAGSVDNASPAVDVDPDTGSPSEDDSGVLVEDDSGAVTDAVVATDSGTIACGDGRCDAGETCIACSADCGTCPALDPPAGRANWSIATAKLTTGSVNADWLKVGTYAFDSARHAVHATMWSWTQAAPVHRAASGVVPNGTCAGGAGEVRPCSVLVPGGFMADANDVRDGAYSILTEAASGNPYVRIVWNTASHAWFEEWWIPRAALPGYAAMRLKAAYDTTLGFAYGSNAPLTTRRAYSSVHDATGLTYERWSRAACSGTGCTAPHVVAAPAARHTVTSPFAPYTVCGAPQSWLMTYFAPTSSQHCAGIADSSIQNYVVRPNSGDRRDAWWLWHTCLTVGSSWTSCYGCTASDRHGGSHVNAMVQVLDDSGNFLGYVGVEPSFHEGSCGNATESRDADMLSIFRMTPDTGYLTDITRVP